MKAFVSYSHRDQNALERLHVHLAMLRRDGTLSGWHDRDILPGGSVDKSISRELDSAQLFLPLISPDFLSSNYCYEKEMQRAIERHENGKMWIVPVILEPCDWQSSPLKEFKALPRDGKPISDWTNPNTAFLDVVTGLRHLIEELHVRTSPPIPSSGGSALAPPKYRLKRSFDEIDRDDFRREAFQTVSDYFRKAIAELNTVDGVRARYEDIGPQGFRCTVLNRLMRDSRDGTGHITVRASAGRAFSGLGDIYYSLQPGAPENTANGGFSISADEYDLFFSGDSFDHSGRDRRWFPAEIAHRLWEELLESAGITYG